MCDSLEVLIPNNMQDEIIEKLDETHLVTESMMRLAKDRFFWTGMRKEIMKKYNECVDCQENRDIAKLCLLISHY